MGKFIFGVMREMINIKNCKSCIIEKINPLFLTLWIASLFFETEYKLMTTLIVLLILFNFSILTKSVFFNNVLSFCKNNKGFVFCILFFIAANSFNILFINFTIADSKFTKDFLKYSTFFIVPFLLLYNKKAVYNTLLELVFVALIFSLEGIYDYFILGFNRAGDIPTLYGYLLLLLFPFSIAWCKVTDKFDSLYLLASTILFVSLILTKTRACWIAGLLAICITIFFIRKSLNFKNLKFPIIIGILLLLCSFPILSQRMQDSINYKQNYSIERVYIWKSSLQMGKEHFWLGIGQDRSRFKELYDSKYQLPESKEKHIIHPHNNFLYFFVRNGIFGLIAFILLQIFQIKYFLKSVYDNNKTLRILSLIGIWIFTVTLVGSFFEAYFHFIKIQKPYLALLGLIICSIECYKNTKKDL